MNVAEAGALTSVPADKDNENLNSYYNGRKVRHG
jgi:hypothetical protein